jgi:UDP-glucose 4-epimerase
MRYLVFGGAGYLGSHLVCELLDDGNDVSVFDNFSGNIKSSYDSRVRIISGDICVRESFAPLESEKKFDGVFHLAAKKSVAESLHFPEAYFNVNIKGTENVVNFCKSLGIKNIVFTSSAAVYGENQISPLINEDGLTAPISPYGESKLRAEDFLESESKKQSVSAVSLRVFNIVGASFPSLFDPQGENVLPLLIRAIKQKSEFTIFGNDYSTKDGTCVRDYVNVSDVAKGHVRAMKYLESIDEPFYDAFNICSGEGKSVLELIELINSMSDFRIIRTFGARRPGDAPQVIGDFTKALHTLDWSPETKIQQSISQSLER